MRTLTHLKAPGVAYDACTPQTAVTRSGKNLFTVFAIISDEMRRCVVTRAELQQSRSFRWRVEQPLLGKGISKEWETGVGNLTFTLLSSPELISTGWPGTHSRAVTAPSCAPRTMYKSRPPALRSHRAMCPVDDAVARMGCPSAPPGR